MRPVLVPVVAVISTILYQSGKAMFAAWRKKHLTE